MLIRYRRLLRSCLSKYSQTWSGCAQVTIDNSAAATFQALLKRQRAYIGENGILDGVHDILSRMGAAKVPRHRNVASTGDGMLDYKVVTRNGHSCHASWDRPS